MTTLKTAVEYHKELRSGAITAEELLNTVYANIDSTDPQVKAYLCLLKKTALESAQKVDCEFKKGDELPFLAGIPISIKDNICMMGTKTTCASKLLSNFESPYNATVIDKINENRLIPVGKVNLDEFAMGSSTENSALQPTFNPWKISCVPGGSSGGSAASVAARQTVLSIGSDTGGSIRQPAAFCGVVGMKPTYGTVSRYGLVAFASSLDQIGPFSTTVEDTAHLLNAISGFDPKDSTSNNTTYTNFAANLKHDIKGLKLGVPKEVFSSIVDSKVQDVIMNALKQLEESGCSWEEMELPALDYALPTYYILASAEASANLSRFDGVRYTSRAKDVRNLKEMYLETRGQGFGSEVKRRIILGTYALSSGYYDAYYLKAQKARTLVTKEFEEAFKRYDLIVSPTAPTPAFKVGEKADPHAMHLCDILTIPTNLAGLPGLSIPCGFVDGLPVGLQLVGKAFDDKKLLNVGYVYQQKTNFHHQEPQLS